MTAHVRPLAVNAIPEDSARIRTAGALRLLTWPALAASGADAVVTARCGGVSSGPYATLNLSLSVGDDPVNVLENRRRLAAALGARLSDFVFARQVHGAGVRIVGEADRGRGAFSLEDAIPDADALVTRSPGVVLAILAADCAPIVLHDPAAGVLACVHSGWRGTVARVSAAALAAMQSLGSRPSQVVAGVGPVVAPARYQVGADVYQAVTGAFGSAATSFIRPDSVPERWLLDLWAANRFVLREAGLPAAQIHVTDLPTGSTDLPAPAGTATSPTAAGPGTSHGPAGPGTSRAPAGPAASRVPAGPGTSEGHPDPATSADPTGSVTSRDPTGSVTSRDPTDHETRADHIDPASHGYFFSDRAARPCGRLVLSARLPERRTPMDVTP